MESDRRYSRRLGHVRRDRVNAYVLRNIDATQYRDIYLGALRVARSAIAARLYGLAREQLAMARQLRMTRL